MIFVMKHQFMSYCIQFILILFLSDILIMSRLGRRSFDLPRIILVYKSCIFWHVNIACLK